MNKAHIMVDCETLSLAPNAVILTIGACHFNPYTGEIFDKFYVRLNRWQGQGDFKLDVSQDTLNWWKRQSKAAQDEALDPPPTSVTNYDEGLEEFFVWVCERETFSGGADIQMWANDPDADCTWLKHSAMACGLELPWKYWDHRSCRTILALGEEIGISRYAFKMKGTAHNALDDAIHQADYVSTIWQKFLIRK